MPCPTGNFDLVSLGWLDEEGKPPHGLPPPPPEAPPPGKGAKAGAAAGGTGAAAGKQPASGKVAEGEAVPGLGTRLAIVDMAYRSTQAQQHAAALVWIVSKGPA